MKCFIAPTADSRDTRSWRSPLHVEDVGRPRIFNHVPGFEAVPVFAEIPTDGTLTCRIRMMA